MQALAGDNRYFYCVDPEIERKAMVARHAETRPLRHELSRMLEAAEQSLDEQPDRAALLLDGMAFQIARAWYAQNNIVVPPLGALLDDLARRAPEHGWRLRLALRAPHARARAVHLRDLVHTMLHGDETGSIASAALDDCLAGGTPALRDALPVG